MVRTQDGSNSARHWLVGNVPGKVLRTGFRNENTTAGVTILQPYHGPHPPALGTPGRTDYVHVYGQFVVRALPSEPSTQLTEPPAFAVQAAHAQGILRTDVSGPPRLGLFGVLCEVQAGQQGGLQLPPLLQLTSLRADEPPGRFGSPRC